MIRLFTVMLLLLPLGAIASCRESSAEDSGALVVYASGPRPLAEAIASAFTEETGIAVELFSATTGQIMAKLEAERYNRRADVVILASPIAAEHLKQQDRLLTHHITNPERFEPKWLDPDGAYHSPNAAAVGIAIRAELDRPNLDWSDVLGDQPDWRIVMPSPTRSGSSGEFVLGYTIQRGEDAWQLFEQGAATGMEFASANSQAIAGLLSGTYDAIVGAVDYLILREINRGAPIKLVFPASGSVVVERPVGILAGTSRPEQARAFVDFCFSDHAQSLSVETGLIPANLQAQASADRPMPSAIIPTDAAAGLEQLQITMRRFQYELEGAAAR